MNGIKSLGLMFLALLFFWSCEEESLKSKKDDFINIASKSHSSGNSEFYIEHFALDGHAVYTQKEDEQGEIPNKKLEENWTKANIRWGFRKKTDKGNEKAIL